MGIKPVNRQTRWTWLTPRRHASLTPHTHNTHWSRQDGHWAVVMRLQSKLANVTVGVGRLGRASTVRFRANRTSGQHRRMTECDPLLPSAIQSSCVAVFLFDQLVRAQQDRCRHIEAKRLGGRHIEHGLVFHRQLHRQIGRLLALKDAVDVGGGAASMAYLVRPI